MDVNFANYENSVIRFDFPPHISTQLSVARVYFARFQRAPEGSEHSTAEGGHHIVQCCGVRCRKLRGIDAIMFGNGPMHTEHYKL